ncbi:hypothetical protein BTR14_14425 [Rhizobium rhizosphaerae]|uniref:AbrB/MazE/SpoVT family DNA-binding domain-containing protein n=1 Tax=Xaviernesmea rhizosphaerae TaxID=1672749 RepID=A0ABX3PB56_9HYPH|nr:hypothetical protein [Xaviernesmea rhizosphaerae]OQP85663.1 hypothetical protein BTR14_14425 [Xaviernesmea rhizosphaerae]
MSLIERRQGQAVELVQDGADQWIRIPSDLALPGHSALLHREGERLVIEPVPATGLLNWLSTLTDWEGDFPELDEQAPPPRDVDL